MKVENYMVYSSLESEIDVLLSQPDKAAHFLLSVSLAAVTVGSILKKEPS